MTFTPDSSEDDVQVHFEFDTSSLTGIDVVVFENLYRIGTVTNRTPEEEEKNDIPTTQRLVAYHRDINDEGQTVTVRASGLASDKLASDLVQTGAAIGGGVAVAAVVAAGAIAGMRRYKNRKH